MNASLSDLGLAYGEPERAITYADACIERAEETLSPRNIAKGRRARGLALVSLGETEQGHGELALEAARTVGNPSQLQKTLEALGRTQEARAVVEDVARSLSDHSLRDRFLASPQIAALRNSVTS